MEWRINHTVVRAVYKSLPKFMNTIVLTHNNNYWKQCQVCPTMQLTIYWSCISYGGLLKSLVPFFSANEK